MPLPKSILCSACKKTYPEGWTRCPYCGHDPMRARQDSVARKFMQKKVQEFEQKTRRDRGEPRKQRPQQQGARPQTAETPRPEGAPRGRRRRRRGRGGAQPSGSAPPAEQRPRPPQQEPKPAAAEGAKEGGTRRRRFRRRRGGRGGSEPKPTS